MEKFRKIAVLAGGISTEREVSIESGRNVADALESLGKYEVVRTVIDADSLEAMPEDVDAVYIALHGGWGENGGVQTALDALRIPYTGPGAEASRLAMDKIASKERFDACGVPTAPWCRISEGSLPPFPFPFVVKTARGGSSIGVHLAKDVSSYEEALRMCLKLDSAGVIAEKYIAGREATVGIISGEALPVLEICSPGGWYDYEAKYLSDRTRYEFLKEGPLAADLKRIALDAYRSLGCRGVSRVDFRIGADGRAYVLEINTSPGFTSHSLVPKAGMATGLTFAEVCEKILLAAEFDAEKGGLA